MVGSSVKNARMSYYISPLPKSSGCSKEHTPGWWHYVLAGCLVARSPCLCWPSRSAPPRREVGSSRADAATREGTSDGPWGYGLVPLAWRAPADVSRCEYTASDLRTGAPPPVHQLQMRRRTSQRRSPRRGAALLRRVEAMWKAPQGPGGELQWIQMWLRDN